MDTKLNIAGAPPIEGLTFRQFRGEADYPQMAALIGACKVADQIERTNTIEDIANTYRHLDNCNPQEDMLFAEVDRQVVAYGRIWWLDDNEGARIYMPFGFLHPDWRGKGLGRAMWSAAEGHIRCLAAEAPVDKAKFIQVQIFETEIALKVLLERRGYTPVRYETHMVRDLSEPIPDAPMPAGIEVRPVKPEHYRTIFDASNEAFLDHWGITQATEEQYRQELESPDFHPELWKVGWDGDQMAGVVHNFIIAAENEEYRRKRGYTEGICTRRPWRKLGLARSLLVQSMQMFKEMGMTETALSVDSQNISGAFRLYEGVGYRKVKQQTLYRKAVE